MRKPAAPARIPPRIADVAATLRRLYGAPAAPPSNDPFELILWENVAYLARPERRAAAFALLARSVGTRPLEILKASNAKLRAVTAHGIVADTFVAKLRQCAQIAIDEFGSDIDAAIRLPLRQAKRALLRFPGIGEPAAEKILLFTRRQPSLAPDSNALRVLSRVGLIDENPSYAKTYAAARAVARELGDDYARLIAVHQLLQQHGQTLCKRSVPKCGDCPLRDKCAFYRAQA